MEAEVVMLGMCRVDRRCGEVTSGRVVEAMKGRNENMYIHPLSVPCAPSRACGEEIECAPA